MVAGLFSALSTEVFVFSLAAPSRGERTSVRNICRQIIGIISIKIVLYSFRPAAPPLPPRARSWGFFAFFALSKGAEGRGEREFVNSCHQCRPCSFVHPVRGENAS